MKLGSRRNSDHPAPSVPSGSESTDEYARIILASRSAKMRKWKTSSSTIGQVGFDSTTVTGRGDHSRRGIPSFGDYGTDTMEESDITQERGAPFGVMGGNKEIEWVDWLDEYRRMKEAKVREEHAALVDEVREQDEPKSPAAEEKGKWKSIDTGESERPPRPFVLR
jgi:hypothetical protein